MRPYILLHPEAYHAMGRRAISLQQLSGGRESDGGEPNAAINAIDEKDHAIPWQRTHTSRAMWGWPRLGVGQDERATCGRRQPEDISGDRMAARCHRHSRNRRRVLDGGSMPA